MPTHPFSAFLAAIEAADDAETERLTHLLTPESEADLIALAASADADKKWWAARALAHCGTERAVSLLANMLREDDNALRSVAAFALGHLHSRAAEEVTGVLEQVAALLSDDDGLVRQSAADALALCGDGALPALEAVLQSSHQGARARAAYAVRKIATMATAPLLFQHLNDENYLVRTYSYEALDEMGLLDNVIVTL